MKSGKCACCESTVRWPSNLLVFRCVVCGTVNDLPGSVGRRAREFSLAWNERGLTRDSAADYSRSYEGDY